MAYTNQQIADAYKSTVGAGTMSEADFVTAAKSQYGVSDDQLWGAQDILKGNVAATPAAPAASDAAWSGSGSNIKAGNYGVTMGNGGVPSTVTYYDNNGQQLTSSTFNAESILKNSQKFGLDMSNLSGIAAGLEANKIGYKPYELYGGTGSDHGIDLRDLASGGLGTAYDWTKDANVGLKGPTAAASLAQSQQFAKDLGITPSSITTGGGISPDYFKQLVGGDGKTKPYALFNGSTASWYDTPEAAAAAQQQYGGNVIDLSGAGVVDPKAKYNGIGVTSGNYTPYATKYDFSANAPAITAPAEAGGLLGGVVAPVQNTAPTYVPQVDATAQVQNTAYQLPSNPYLTGIDAVDPATETIQGRIENLLSQNSPVIRQAAERARQAFADRGLLNSSMAEQAAQEAMISKAIEIAGPDASTYFQNRTNKLNWLNRFAENDMNNSFDMKKMQYANTLSKDLAQTNANLNLQSNYQSAIQNVQSQYQQQVLALQQNTNMDATSKQAALSDLSINRDNSVRMMTAMFQQFPGWSSEWSSLVQMLPSA